MASERPTAPTPALHFDDRAERAARVRAMLARWENEAVADEPEWNVEDSERVLVKGTRRASDD